MSDPLGYYEWTIDADLAIRFRAAGFREILRREPQHVADQRLTMEQRGGLSFSEQPYDNANSAP